MKKVTLFATVVAASMLAGGVTAYTIGQVAGNDTRTYIPAAFGEQAGNHFTSYEADKYPDLTYAAENAVKGVVNIDVTKEVKSSRNSRFGGGGGFDPFFEFFGIPQGSFEQPQQPQQQRGGGSGVIISPDGYIVTNNHVVEDASEVKVTLNDNRTFTAKVIGTDPTTDVALVKIDATDLPNIPFGESDALRLGEWVLAIGSPYGLQSTVTAGIISAKARNLDIIPSQFRIESFIQTDAAVNPGNSGGALVNTRGELVGINTVIKSPTGSFAGYSFAVPTSIVKKVVVDLKEYGVVQRAMLGVTFQEINDAFIEQRGKETGINEKGGVYVVEVDPEGAAHAAGIRKGDVIIGIQELSIDNSSKLLEEIAKHRPNDKVTVKIKRGSDVKQMEVVLRNKSGNTGIVKSDVVAAIDALGGQFADISDRARKELKINGGVQVVAISGDGVLAQARIRTGYIITAINDRPVRSITDLNRITSKIESIDGIYPDGRAVSYSIVGK